MLIGPSHPELKDACILCSTHSTFSSPACGAPAHKYLVICKRGASCTPITITMHTKEQAILLSEEKKSKVAKYRINTLKI